MKYAEIIIAVSTKSVDKGFHYVIPEHMEQVLDIGMRVLVPFGNGNKNVEGYVIGFSQQIDFDPKKAKSILQVLDGYRFFNQELLMLSIWMKDKYYTTLYSCLQTMIPKGMKLRSEYIVYLNKDSQLKKVSKKQKEILDYISTNFGVSEAELKEVFGTSISNTLKTLKDNGQIDIKQISEVKDYTIRIKYASINYENENIEDLLEELLQKDNAQTRVINLLIENPSLPISDIKEYLKISDSPINTLEKNNILRIELIESRRNPLKNKNYKEITAIQATTKQKEAIDYVSSKLYDKNKKPILIHGVTGSGKTEIYMQIISNVLNEGKQAIVLVPEISLTPQTVEKFIGRFGDKVSVTHSRLSLGERFDQWKKAFDGDISIMIGPRSAVFTPFENLGVIIIDEEHEGTYKSENTPKYSTKEVAKKRSELANSLLVLGSATPSLDTYYEVETGKVSLVTIDERINKLMPSIKVIDMRKELANSNMSMFSEELLTKIKDVLSRKEQVILFLNRRGFSTFVSCRKCGYVMGCDECSVNYTYHIYSDKLLCHYCGKQIKNPKLCPICASKYIKYFGVGTQKVEDEISKLLPEAKVLRMDLDTTKRKNSHDRIITQFASRQADILLGTQMVTKGLDFPNVSLVGILAADLSLNQGDFRSAEMTYQLLTQVSGRAGRAALPGEVYIQTYNPEHYSIKYTQSNDYIQFYNHEITIRRQMDYPPFSHIFSIIFISDNEKKIILLLNRLADIMKYYNKKNQFEMLGPAPAVISKIRNKYRWKLFVKAKEEERLKNFVTYCIDKLSNSEDVSNVNMNLTINPTYIE